ncbi:NADPH-dependent FMN reductase [Enterococcus sp. 8G7_MSG3316]|uniref:NADPH-dependent FMN reductase n=1 Tax=Candidatus Enterococcus testudinis TaxID=1834191 RepID=A0A242A862_9ENTE|nr:NAD(P)H-dependent oxidoreductase [Enterococcus sp. 8G7_MSG3316]OTN77226.1 NADPH-dependent FMN reductase [Enterococcus sp. 8G7_MSG3316]
MTKKIGFIVGSLREGSFNKIVAKKFADLLPEGFEAVFLEIGQLPFYNEDLDVDGQVPAEWASFRQDVQGVDGVFFFTPEYNRSVPAVLKNALDVGSRPYGASSWGGKPALVVSVSPGAIAGFGANHHLRQSLVFLDMPTLQQPEAYIGGITNLIDENNEIKADTVNFFQTITDKYIEFFNRFN